MNKKTTGTFSKVRKLVTVLRKCNGKAVIGDSNALISPKAAKILVYCSLLALMGMLFLGVYLIQPAVGIFITVKNLAQILMLSLLIVSFILAVKDIVTVLYTSDDIEPLLPLPFSATQIVMAKLVAASVFPVILSIVLMNSICLGFGIRAGTGLPFIIGIVLSSVLIPVTGIAAAALLVVVIFRVFGVLRNRDITVALGGIFTFGLSVAYIFISSRLRGSSGEAEASLNAFSSVSAAFPNISFMNQFMFEGSIPGLLISLAFSFIVIVLALLAVKAFYLSTALSMQNTGTSKKAVSQDMIRSGKKNSALRALTVYEAKSARRNPAYMIYGFVISFLWPVLFILPLLLKNSILGNITVPLDTIPALLASLSFAVTASCFSCGYNILPGSAFSREGSSFSALRALPLDLTDYCRSKRNFFMLICSLGSVLYVLIIGVICIAAGFISIGNAWTIPVSAVLSFLLNLIFIDLMMLKDSKKPRFNWDSETELSRKLGVINLIIIAAGLIMFILFITVIVLAPMLNGPHITQSALIICGALLLISLVLAITINSRAIKTAANNLEKYE